MIYFLDFRSLYQTSDFRYFCFSFVLCQCRGLTRHRFCHVVRSGDYRQISDFAFLNFELCLFSYINKYEPVHRFCFFSTFKVLKFLPLDFFFFSGEKKLYKILYVRNIFAFARIIPGLQFLPLYRKEIITSKPLRSASM